MKHNLKVAYINPPYFERYSRSQRSPGVIKSGTMYYPYWLAHSLALLDQNDFETFLYDCPAANIPLAELLKKLEEFKPDLCVLDSSTASSNHDYQVAKAIKDQFPETRICMVGTHVTALWDEVLRDHPAVTYVAIGEYDETILDLAKALESEKKNAGQAPSVNIAGLGLRLKDGTVARGPVRPPIENVDALPWIAPVYKKFLDVKNYYFSLASYPMVMLIGGRGCVAKCTYCVYPQVMHGHRYRTRSPQSITDEMLWIQQNMPEVQEIVFEDDTFTGDREFAREVAVLVQQKGIRLKWFANVRANIDKETLSYMKDAGFRCCAVGFESADDILLKNMWKGSTISRQKEFVKDCHDLGIIVHGCFMFGFPGETQETMEKTLRYAMDLNPDSAQFYPVMPFPGTSYYKWAKENNYLATQNFSDWLTDEGGHRCVLNLPGLQAKEIEAFCEKAYQRFYFRPRYMWYKMKQSLQSLTEGIRSVRSFVYYLFYLVFSSKKRDQAKPFDAPKLSVPQDWYRVHKIPKGRMFEQEDYLKGKTTETSEATKYL